MQSDDKEKIMMGKSDQFVRRQFQKYATVVSIIIVYSSEPGRKKLQNWGKKIIAREGEMFQ